MNKGNKVSSTIRSNLTSEMNLNADISELSNVGSIINKNMRPLISKGLVTQKKLSINKYSHVDKEKKLNYPFFTQRLLNNDKNIGSIISSINNKSFHDDTPIYFCSGEKNNEIVCGSSGKNIDGSLVDQYSLFRIGSITKHMIAFAVKDVLKGGDKVSDFSNSFSGKNFYLMDLINHGSGLVSYSEDKNPKEYERTEWVEDILNQQTMFSEGEMFLYSNYGYAILGILIEEVLGMSLNEYLITKFFTSFGMLNSGYISSDSDKKWVSGHIFNNDFGKIEREPFGHLHQTKAFSAAGFFSCGKDMKTWISNLDFSYLQTLIDCPFRTNYEFKSSKKVKYNNGFFIDGEKLFHYGFFPGFLSGMVIVPSKKKWAFALTGSENIDIKLIMSELVDSLDLK